MNISVALSVCAASAGALLALTAAPAHAARVTRTVATNPAGICQSALPVFDGVIRKRPKAIANEGDVAAFVTCAWSSQGVDSAVAQSPTNPVDLTLYLGSLDGTSKTISCTAVAGYQGFNDAPSVTKTLTTSFEYAGPLTWTADDFGFANNLPTPLIAMSCNLPPGAAFYDSYLTFTEEIGS